jgi:hypothetical protein
MSEIKKTPIAEKPVLPSKTERKQETKTETTQSSEKSIFTGQKKEAQYLTTGQETVKTDNKTIQLNGVDIKINETRNGKNEATFAALDNKDASKGAVMVDDDNTGKERRILYANKTQEGSNTKVVDNDIITVNNFDKNGKASGTERVNTKQVVDTAITDADADLKNMGNEIDNKSKGWLNGSVNWLKNNVGTEGKAWAVDPRSWVGLKKETGSDYMNIQLEKKQEDLNKIKEDYKKGEITGAIEGYQKLTNSSIENVIDSVRLSGHENQADKDKAAKLLEGNAFAKDKIGEEFQDYKLSQDAAVDLVADIATGAAVTGTLAAGLISAVPTGGASLAGSIALCAAEGATIKTAIKASNDWSAGRDYESLGHDVITGAVDGSLARVMPGIGNKVSGAVSGQLAKFGGTTVAQNASEAILFNPLAQKIGIGTIDKVVDNSAKILATAAGDYAQGFTFGSVTSGTDYLANTFSGENEFDLGDFSRTTLNGGNAGGMFGAVANPLGRGISNKFNNFKSGINKTPEPAPSSLIAGSGSKTELGMLNEYYKSLENAPSSLIAGSGSKTELGMLNEYYKSLEKAPSSLLPNFQ